MNIVVTGSIAYDYLMRFPGSFKEHILTEALHQVSLSFLVEDMTKHWGGVAANIAFTMARFGISPKLMGTAGRDFPDYRRWLSEAGVDTSTVKQIDSVFTASFFCNTDEENNQIASFYSGAMALANQYTLAEALNGAQPDLVVVSPNDPQAMSNLTQECRDNDYRFVYDPSQQVARLDGNTLRHDMQGAYLMIVNEYEAHLICDKTGMTMDDLRQTIDLLVITHGGEGSEIYTNGDRIHVPAFAPTEIKDPTGAGDAFRAGFFTGLAYDRPLEMAGAMGALCATYTLEHIGPQGHRYNINEYVERFRQHQDDQGQLDVLLKHTVTS
ncbi:carbohydrate kinase family protein [Phototrophicus methaneseepsis]|uniref:Carbohydrate kinase family protein n=1 Tax=Phototrophicus methaneseepsis TaxID=2710758 RepID=A0A7S8E5T4_9CHLR|nr:carbohydrate kinase family protein [Phototrophicus methaneseepsis]QPC80885.1 carbohydrate kinase family protein [Phototrophicus methaneseepsis]